jgi:uncharacterized protein YbaP (TraB family)
MKLLWAIDSESALIHLFGGGPPPPYPWSNAAVESLVRESDEFWNEVPEITETDRALAVRYGVDPTAPLPTWLDADGMARVEKAASETGVSRDMLLVVRPWLAAQLLKNAFQANAGTVPEHSAEAVLTAIAKEAGVPVHSEVGSPEDTFRYFADLPREAELAFLQMTLDDIEAGQEAFLRDCEGVARGDESVGERLVGQFRARYAPAYEPLLVRRNRNWVGRIQRMLEEGTRAFICVGSAHLAGPDSVQAMLSEAGIAIRRAQARSG